MFWNSRRLLFSKTFYYGIFEDFSFRMFWNIPRLLFLHILFLFRTFLSTEQQKYCYLQPNSLHFLIITKSKQNAVSLVYRRIRWISQRASSNNALRRFLSFSWLLHSLSVFFASVCNDRQLIMVGNPFLSFFGRQFARQFNRQFNLPNPFGHKYHSPWQKVLYNTRFEVYVTYCYPISFSIGGPGDRRMPRHWDAILGV